MAPAAIRVRLEFQIESLDPSRPTTAAVRDVEALAADLQSSLRSQGWGDGTVTIARAEGLPLLPELQHILVNVDWDAVKKGIEGSVAGFATTQFLAMVRDRITNLRVRAVPTPAASAATQKPHRKKPPARRKPKGKARPGSRKTKNSGGKNKKKKKR
jgi:hypothetical protein